jgi:hypothetical protein
MIIDLQDFFYAFYREILFIGLGFILVSALIVAIIVILKAVDEKR